MPSNRLQDEVIDRLDTRHGGVSVDDRFADEVVRVTIRTGREYKISPEGVATVCGVNFSIDWNAR